MEKFALAQQKLQDLLQSTMDFARQLLQLSVCRTKNQSFTWALPLTLSAEIPGFRPEDSTGDEFLVLGFLQAEGCLRKQKS